MEKFVVSARKYRPATFDTVVGQSHITTTLKNAIRTNHLAQAFLFCGPRGVGKTTCARILAKTINCENLSEDTEACDACDSCKSFNQNASFNIHELDAASNNSVEDIRNLIDQVRFPPQTGKYKIYIIDEVHMLSQAAFNAFLKTLEEPPSYAIFILATTEKYKILPTILSRCQIFDFNRIQIKDITDHLAKIADKETIKADYQALELIAQKADGGLRDALSMFDLNVTFSADNHLTYKETLENLHILDYDYYFKLTNFLVEGNTSQVLLVFDEILKKGFDGHQFVVGLNEHFRNLMVCKDEATVKLLQVSESVQQKYLEQAQKTPLGFILSALSVGSQLDISFKASKSQRLHVEIGLIKLSQIQNVLVLSELPVSANEKKNLVPENKVQETATKQISEQSVQILSPQISTTVRQPVSVVEEPAKPVYITPKTPVISRLKSTNNLDILSNSAGATENNIANVSTNQAENKPFTKEQLLYFWEFFHQNREKESEKVMLNREFDLKEGNTIHLQLDNTIQGEILTEIKQELMDFLRKSLHNFSLQVTSEVVEREREYRPYTAQEKFEFLANKNPALRELREILNLDLIY